MTVIELIPQVACWRISFHLLLWSVPAHISFTNLPRCCLLYGYVHYAYHCWASSYIFCLCIALWKGSECWGQCGPRITTLHRIALHVGRPASTFIQIPRCLSSVYYRCPTRGPPNRTVISISFKLCMGPNMPTHIRLHIEATITARVCTSIRWTIREWSVVTMNIPDTYVSGQYE